MVFVIGGNGFVGSAFVRLFESKGIPFQSIEKDNYQDFIGKSCDILINVNGNSKKFLANEDPLREFHETTESVCASLHNYKYTKYVHCSTCDVYNDFKNPLNNHEKISIDPVKQSRYGFHKRLAEQLVQYEAKDHIIVRFGGFVGPNMRKNPIFDILNGGPLWLDPKSELQFLHTDDAASLVWGLVERGYRNEIFNVCGDGLIKLQDVIDAAGKDVPVKPEATSVLYQINIDKLKSVASVPLTKKTVLDFVKKWKEQSIS